jgi:hypothetical protein
MTLKAHALNQEKQPSLSNGHTNWDDSRCLINQRLTSAAVTFFNETIQFVGWNATPEHTETLKAYDCPISLTQTIEEKRRFGRDWRRLRTPKSKILLNTATQEELLNYNNNDCIQTFLQCLTPTVSEELKFKKLSVV